MKRYALIIRIISVIELLGGILTGIIFAVKYDDFLTLVYFTVAACIVFILTASYANLLETTDDTNEMLHRMMEQREKSQENKTLPVAASVNPCAKTTATGTISQRYAEKTAANKDPDDPAYIMCAHCGTRQKANREVCFNCGAKFEVKQ